MAKVIEASDPHAAWATMSVRTLTNIFLFGLLAGLTTFILYVGLDKLVFEPVLCNESAGLARCESKGDYAGGVAIVIGSIVGLVLLVRERVYRPILAIIGVAVGLWGIFGLILNLPFLLAVLTATIMFGLAYVLFSWLVQPTSLVISVVGVVAVAALARLAIG